MAKSHVCGVLWCQDVVPGGIALNLSEGSLDREEDKGRLAQLVR
jgi:hypothetical protein